MKAHHLRRRPATARRSLVKAARSSEITLVLGAGVSFSRGLPTWEGLVSDLWSDLQPPRRVPEWIKNRTAAPHPLAYQILFEEIEGALAAECAKKRGCKLEDLPPQEIHDLLVAKLAANLYQKERPGTETDTLSILVGLLRTQQGAANRKIRRVITFNVDEILERETNSHAPRGREPIVHIVPRGSFHPRYDNCANGRPPINLYHLHGFIPASRKYLRGAQDTLVFTDLQYWESVASPNSFANRIMMNALQDSRCVFLGMSMTDVNISRWLGIRTVEFIEDRIAHYSNQGKPVPYGIRKSREAIQRHYWICSESDDSTGLIASHLERRGVSTVAIPNWGADLAQLLNECFP